MTTTDANSRSGVETAGPGDGPPPVAYGRRERESRLRSPVARSALAVAGLWALSRAALIVVLLNFELPVDGDVKYFFKSLTPLVHGGSIHEVLREYPAPVIATMLPQYLASAGHPITFLVLFCASMLLVDGLFTASLWHASGRRSGPAVWFWLCLLPALGPMVYFRFDLIPATLAGLAVLAFARHPRRSGVATAVAAALKLWPVLLFTVFLLRRGPQRVRHTAAFAVTAIAAAAVTLGFGGLRRALSPLTWQRDRGLQIESLVATPLVIARRFGPHRDWHVRESRFHAFEISGWGVHAALLVGSICTVAGLGLLIWLWFRVRAVGDAPFQLLGWLAVATVLVVVVTDKTLSPQYLLWVAGLVAALLVRSPDRSARRFAVLLLLACALTQLEFPVAYTSMTRGHDPLGVGVITVAVRNLLLGWLTFVSCREVVRRTRPSTEQVRASAAGRSAASAT